MNAVDPVKPIAGILAASADRVGLALPMIEAVLGPADFIGPPVPFAHTGYYTAEMGPGLHRWIVSFARLFDPGCIVDVKLATVEIERTLSESGRRRVNIDPGYMDYHKVVLASTKSGAPKIYLGRGIWADIALFYSKGRFHPPEWSFPDFRTGAYDAMFLTIRGLFKQSRKAQPGSAR